MKKLTSFIRSLSISYVLARYNRRFRYNIGVFDLVVLFILYDRYFPANRYAIIIELRRFHHTSDYSRLNKRLQYLITNHLVVINREKKYSISIQGKDVLWTIEKWARLYRIDKIKY